MSPPIVSRWPVRISVPLTAEDRDAEGLLTDAGVQRVVTLAQDAFFDRCRTVDASSIELRATTIRRGTAAVTIAVSVSAGVVEIFQDSFTMAARIRPTHTDGIAADVSCTLSPPGPVPDTMRDEFIALAQSAPYIH